VRYQARSLLVCASNQVAAAALRRSEHCHLASVVSSGTTRAFHACVVSEIRLWDRVGEWIKAWPHAGRVVVSSDINCSSSPTRLAWLSFGEGVPTWVASSMGGLGCSQRDCLLIILCCFLPPLAVWLKRYSFRKLADPGLRTARISARPNDEAAQQNQPTGMPLTALGSALDPCTHSLTLALRVRTWQSLPLAIHLLILRSTASSNARTRSYSTFC
jgi:hypothetical protein